MSYIGNNIRKIRGVKNLNQSDFAELFNLKRASVGAYEEGRAEPKIKTIIDIAKYFGISIDNLLTKELSVNDLFKFDIFREDLLKDSKNNLTPSQASIDLIPIPFIPSNQEQNYLHHRKEKDFLDQFENLQIPLSKGKNYRAFELKDGSMNGEDGGLQKGDIVVCEKANLKSINQLEIGKIYGFESKNDFRLRRLDSYNKTTVFLKPDNSNFYSEELAWKDIEVLWQVKTSISNNISNNINLKKRIEDLENIIKRQKAQ